MTLVAGQILGILSVINMIRLQLHTIQSSVIRSNEIREEKKVKKIRLKKNNHSSSTKLLLPLTFPFPPSEDGTTLGSKRVIQLNDVKLHMNHIKLFYSI